MRTHFIAALTLALCTVAGSQIALAGPTEEGDFVTFINQSRAGAGLPSLSIKPDLVDYARRHTAKMISSGTIFHSTSAELSSASTGWTTMGENVGRGPNPSVLHGAFMNSPSHKANILGDFDRVGVGAARSSDGVLFVTVIFMKSSTSSTTTTTTTAPQSTTTTTPPPTSADTGQTTTTVTTTTTAPPRTTTTTTDSGNSSDEGSTQKESDEFGGHGAAVRRWYRALEGLGDLIWDLHIRPDLTVCFRASHAEHVCIE